MMGRYLSIIVTRDRSRRRADLLSVLGSWTVRAREARLPQRKLRAARIHGKGPPAG
jgi:hypothetical protein